MSSLLEMLSEQTGGDFNLEDDENIIKHEFETNKTSTQILFVSACETCFQNKTIGLTGKSEILRAPICKESGIINSYLF